LGGITLGIFAVFALILKKKNIIWDWEIINTHNSEKEIYFIFFLILNFRTSFFVRKWKHIFTN
jgi:hypothetical protein